ncbi:MAG: type II toxin-antitoxin system RelE/ParE family toxin [Rhizobiaceae bacterium]
MYKVVLTAEFKHWLGRLRDRAAQARIVSRIMRLEDGLFGDAKPVGDGVGELRVDVGPGYRVYFFRAGLITVVVLAGGDKRTQRRDIATAKKRAAEWKERMDGSGD